MTPSEERIARYARIEREGDALGRVIGVRLLRISQQIKVEEMTPALEGSTVIEEPSSDKFPDGRSIKVPRRTLPMAAAAVCEIDNTPIPFPKSRGELDAIIDRLDGEGMAAATIAYSRLAPAATTPTDEDAATPAGAEDKAKKSSGTATLATASR